MTTENGVENQKKKLEAFFKMQKERLEEIEELKKTTKCLNDDIFKLKKELNTVSKENKLKQKVNYILTNKNESLQTKIRKLKEEIAVLKKTKVSLEKELKKSSKGQITHQETQNKVTNENIPTQINSNPSNIVIKSGDDKKINKINAAKPTEKLFYEDQITKREKIRKLIPIKNFYSPLIPFTISKGLFEKYRKIFGDHSCHRCEHVEQKDCFTGETFSINICKDYYISLHAVNLNLNDVVSISK